MADQDCWERYIATLPDDSTAPLRHRDPQVNLKVDKSLTAVTSQDASSLDKNLSDHSPESSISHVVQSISDEPVSTNPSLSPDTPLSYDGVVTADRVFSSRVIVLSIGPIYHEPAISSGPSSLPITTVDAGDESLQRYKESLGLGGKGKDISDPNDPRVCIILSLTMDSQGRAPVTIDLSTKGAERTLKDKPFKIKEGAKFSMTAKFKVQHEILSGLHYVQVVKRKGVRVGKDQEMIGSYAPNTDQNPVYTKRFAEEDAPTGMLARGHYTAISTFVDDDKHKHLEFEWSFDIAKDW